MLRTTLFRTIALTLIIPLFASNVDPMCVHQGNGKDEFECSYDHYRSWMGPDGKAPSERGVTGVKQRVDGSETEQKATQEVIQQV
jgi:hypothetical protein